MRDNVMPRTRRVSRNTRIPLPTAYARGIPTYGLHGRTHCRDCCSVVEPIGVKRSVALRLVWISPHGDHRFRGPIEVDRRGVVRSLWGRRKAPLVVSEGVAGLIDDMPAMSLRRPLGRQRGTGVFWEGNGLGFTVWGRTRS